MSAVRIEADYLLETPFDPQQVAEAMAGAGIPLADHARRHRALARALEAAA